MNEAYRLQQINRLNKLPVNQYAQMFLKKAGVVPHPYGLYLLQLVEWGLRNGVVSVIPVYPIYMPPVGARPKPEDHDAQNRRDFLEIVERLYWLKRPEKLMDLLLKNGPTNFPEDEPWVDPEELARKKSPEAAAQYLVENLQGGVGSERATGRAEGLKVEAAEPPRVEEFGRHL